MVVDPQLSKTGVCATVILGGLLYAVAVAYYRLNNELRKFPGPRLAAITRYYTGYFDLVKDGDVVNNIEELHRKYGPVVRTGPSDLHFSNPQAHATIYSFTTKFRKEEHFYRGFTMPGSLFGTADPAEAKARTAIISPMFSRRAISKLEYLVQEKVDLLIKQLLAYKTHVDLYSAFRATALDVIVSYCFGQSYDALTFPGFRHPILVGVEAAVPAMTRFQHFNFLIPIFMSLPSWLLNFLSPDSRGLNDFRERLGTRIDQLLKDPSILEQSEQETVYHHLLKPQPTKYGPQILPKETLVSESMALLIAGSDTVGNTMALGVFHVLSNPTIYAKLVEELDEAWPSAALPMKHDELSKLPYLTAVIKESLRIGHGVVSPPPRVVGPTSVEIAGFEVPAGTTVSIGSTFLHLNEDIFPDPHTFNPDRWLQPNSHELEQFLVPFSKGPRQCAGINLAWCELYLIYANVFRKLSLEIYDTTAEDFKFGAYFLPRFRGKPLRANVTSRLA